MAKKRSATQSITFYLQRVVGGILALEICLMVVYFGFFYAPTFLQVQPYTIVSGSMVPTIPIGSEVYIDEDQEQFPIEVGDIIAFNQEGMDYPIVHRVISESGDFFTTKGDANTGTETVPKSEVIGKCICHIPELGNIGIKADEHKSQFILITLLTVGAYVVVSRVGTNQKPQQTKKSS